MSDLLKQYLARKGLKIDSKKATARQSVVDYLQQAKVDDKAFLDIASPTAADRNAQINKLTRQNIYLMQMTLGVFDVVGKEVNKPGDIDKQIPREDPVNQK